MLGKRIEAGGEAGDDGDETRKFKHPSNHARIAPLGSAELAPLDQRPVRRDQLKVGRLAFRKDLINRQPFFCLRPGSLSAAPDDARSDQVIAAVKLDNASLWSRPAGAKSGRARRY